MIRIYDDNLNVDIADNADVEEVIKVMEELDQVYKARSKNHTNNVSVHKDTLMIAFYAMMHQPGAELERILNEIKKNWDSLTQVEQDKLENEFKKLIDEGIITDPEKIEWIQKIDEVEESDFL